MSEEKTADHTCQRRRQDVVDELAQKTLQQRHLLAHKMFSRRPAFFKQAIEFQTCVMGSRWPGKRNFCGGRADLPGKSP
jgi:hypothetical protein